MENIASDAHKPSFETKPGARLLISAAVFGALFSYLFAKQAIGLNVLCFVLFVYAFAWINKSDFIVKRFRDDPMMYLVCIPVIFIGVMIFTSGGVLAGLGILAILFVMFVQYLALSGTALHRWYQSAFLLDMFFGAFNRVLICIGSFVAGVVNAVFKNSRGSRKSAAVGLLGGFALLIVIVPILIAADPNVAAYVGLFFTSIRFDDILLYGFMFLFGASVIAAPAANAKRDNIIGMKNPLISKGRRPVEGVTSAVALTMVSAIYVIFATIQFSYFFVPHETLRSVLGLTSAAYAVRGFSELIFITCLNFILLGIAMRFTAKRSDGKPQPYLKILYTLLVAFNFVILASSHLRMQIYELSFGATVSRFLSHSFMLLLVILNLIMLVRVYTDKVKLMPLFAVTALLYFCAVMAVGPERYVAEYNIARYEREGKIDTAYLFCLSGDALSDVCDFVTEHPEAFDDEAKQAARNALERGKYYAKRFGWQSLSLAEQRAYGKLQALPLATDG